MLSVRTDPFSNILRESRWTLEIECQVLANVGKCLGRCITIADEQLSL